jgi:hypothetical protein
MRLGFITLLSLFIGFNSEAAVWTASNEWSPAMERKYSQWVQANWAADFFARRNLPDGNPNPYYGIRMDCADTVYSMRIIFSYEQKLPFVIQDPTFSGKTISNQMSRWDRESEIRRLRNFLSFVYDIVSTRSLPNDTYPVALDRATIRPGGLLLTTKKNHHSWSIKDILAIGVPHLVFNSVVGANSGFMLQERQSWPNPEWVFETDFSPMGHAGFRDWRPTNFINKPVWEVPEYSEQQYNIPLEAWVREAQTKLALTQESDDQLLRRMLKTVCDGFMGRVTTVHESLAYKSNHPQCMDYATYDTYSTPNRDRRIFDDLISLRKSYKNILEASRTDSVPSELIQQLNKIFPQISLPAHLEVKSSPRQSIDASSFCLVEYMPQKIMDLAEFKRRLFSGLISNNPNDEGVYRWGEIPNPWARAQSCPSWDAWNPQFSED